MGSCQVCRGQIRFGEVRICEAERDDDPDRPKAYKMTDFFYHLSCFASNREGMGFFCSGEQLAGYKSLSKLDQYLVAEKLPKVKRKLEEDGKPGEPDSKKAKVEDDPAEAARKERMMKAQTQQMDWRRRWLTENLGAPEFYNLLEHNMQEIPDVDVDQALDRLSDVMTFGALEPCGECGGGQLVYQSGVGYRCQGTKCQFVSQSPARREFNIPADLKQRYEDLANYKINLGHRIISNLPVLVSESDKVDTKSVTSSQGGPSRSKDIGRVAGWAADFDKLLQDPAGLQTFAESPDMFEESPEDIISSQSAMQTMQTTDKQIQELKVSLSLSDTPPSQAQEQEAEVMLAQIEEGVSHIENLASQHASGQEVDPVQMWNDLEEKVKEKLVETLKAEQTEKCWENATSLEVCQRMGDFIENLNMSKALSLLKSAQETFPEEDVFEVDRGSILDSSESPPVSEQGEDDDDDGGEQNVDMEEVKNYLSIFKNVFFKTKQKPGLDLSQSLREDAGDQPQPGEEIYPFYQEDFPSKILAGLNSQRKEKTFTDVKIKVGQREFPAHKSVLSSFSPYFKEMLTAGGEEDIVNLNEVEPSGISDLLDYAYTGHIIITKQNVQNMLRAAILLDILPVRDACNRFLQKKLVELPPLETPLETMTTKPLKTYISLMMKSSTGRALPYWEKESMMPPWWPRRLPYTIRSGVTVEDLREIVRACFKYHQREDLLPVKDEIPALLRRLEEKELRLKLALSVLPADFMPIKLSDAVRERLDPQIVQEFEETTQKMWNEMRPSLLELRRPTSSIYLWLHEAEGVLKRLAEAKDVAGLRKKVKVSYRKINISHLKMITFITGNEVFGPRKQHQSVSHH